MAPARKSRSVNKRFSASNEVSPDNDGVNSIKNKLRKKKLTDKLGSQWSKEELEQFYQAYRKYDKDWKKVAAVVRNRSIEMVEALYNMNRAYLSLPEGTASVVGLIAMMTDHYNVLQVGSDSERESNDSPGSRKPLKRKIEKVQLSVSKDSVQSQSIASSDGCLSLLKKRRFDGIQPRAVGKRTPRVPVHYSFKKDDRENYVSPNKRSLGSTVAANDDEIAHVAALALAEAAQRGGSPQVSQTPHIRAEHKSPHVQNLGKMCQTLETASAKFHHASVDEEFLEGSMESRGAENGEYVRDSSSLMDMEGKDSFVLQKGKMIYRKKERVVNIGNHQLDDGGEACSGTEEGVSFSSLKEKVDIEVNNAKLEQSSLKSKRKRSKKLFFGDEIPALDALQTLADVSLMMPASMVESELSGQVKGDIVTVDKGDKSALPEAASTSHTRDKIKLSGSKQKVVHVVSGIEVSTPTKPKLGKESANDAKALYESKEQLSPADRTWKRKRNSVVSKVASTKLNPYPNDPLKSEDVDEENKPLFKEKNTGQVFTQPRQLKTVGSSESSPNSDQKELKVSTAEIPLLSEVSLPIKGRRRWKMIPRRTFIPKEKPSENIILKTQHNMYSTLKDKLSSCMSSYLFRRWCTFEWFYSAIDYPWFAKREFVEYLNHVGLGNIPRLTRDEWSVIKSSLGKPRRFSEHFLREERQKLEQYRESVRKHYTDLRTGISDGLPTDLAKPLYVGQRVIALHPKTREIHDGSVLTVDHDKCRIQFDRPELGVEFVLDIDCMPSNPLDNMPEALRRQVSARKVSLMSKEPQVNGNSSFGGCTTRASPVKGDVNHCVSQAKAATIDNFCVQKTVCAQPCTLTHHQAKEADIHALSELKRALDKKETLLMELKSANTDILENQNDIECLKDSEAFKKHYATVLVELKEASGQVSDAMVHLRQRNTYTGNSLTPWMKPQVSFNDHDNLPGMLDSSLPQELGSTVNEIIKGSRLSAKVMVDAAFQALPSTTEDEDAFTRIGQALDSIDYQQLASNTRLPLIRSQEQVNGSSYNLNQSTLLNDASSPKLHNDSNKVYTEIPLELITSCVATLIMIQTCTERQYPPADVVQMLDSAVTSLEPCSPQNIPIFREIQMCIGRIKTQILALVPT
ncbi:PREDICTED: protein ALWAYS EARLY 2-like isoform X1 [Lupinus angustifolius]|uniref:protein ALWAYS EARLY 2-like isoform X1 n=1 Tax=Lupinus angustifolius TaxID=3871 RepID=UPI00092FB9C9|nr:PREDICTED: protein ALWAYS EARLY 2-like isoform X1 [Lupinus angustifolius]XP_019441173.1 PREDICTED: protein ALWAYS EARLY 2-like isoform X1 [Lupinus angustifolius]XP_019441174.1 PREDICTED: protein ALWAYS EARLY 2-like isoform X1 [Lupinus angustifolius]